MELPPTPSKFHYIFNMRDLSRITSGILKSHPNLYKFKHQMVRLWRNEFVRVMCDRLISKEDQEMMRTHIFNTIGKYFPPQHIEVSTPDEGAVEGGEESGHVEEFVDVLEYVTRDPLLFGDYRNAISEYIL